MPAVFVTAGGRPGSSDAMVDAVRIAEPIPERVFRILAVLIFSRVVMNVFIVFIY